VSRREELKYWRSINRFRIGYERKYAKIFRRAIEGQLEPVMELIRLSSTPEAVERSVRTVLRKDNLVKAFNDLYNEVGVASAALLYNGIESAEKGGVPNLVTKAEPQLLPQYTYVWSEAMAAYLLNDTATYITSIIATSQNVAIRLVQLTTAEAINEGLPLQEIMQRLEKRIPIEWRKTAIWRSELIARTEVLTAQNYGAALGANTAREELGLVLNKKWVAKIDSRTREAHIDINGQTVQFEQKFKVGGTMMAQPGDPNGGPENRCNCRCAVVYVRADGEKPFSKI
jgi:hypothetical protein